MQPVPSQDLSPAAPKLSPVYHRIASIEAFDNRFAISSIANLRIFYSDSDTCS
jgi:hypothetical protein